MIRNVQGFDWDAANIDKCEKHGVSIETIEDVFTRPLQILGDVRHSNLEERYIAVSTMSDGRGIFVGFTYRPGKRGLLIRPITARYMHKRELAKYEKAVAHAKQ